jgi:hypothetical protein
LGHDAAIQTEHLHPVVAKVRDVDEGVITGDRKRRPKLACAGTDATLVTRTVYSTVQRPFGT